MENFKEFLSTNLNVSQEELSTCEDLILVKNVKKGEFLLHAGEICNYYFFVENGLLRMFSVDKNGKEHVILFAPENWIISDRSSLFFNEKSPYYIEAIEDSEVIFAKNDFFLNISERFPQSAAKNERLLHRHINNLQSRVNSLLGDTAEQRYVDFVKKYPNVLARVPQWMVASYLGITPESLSRVRKELVKKKAP